MQYCVDPVCLLGYGCELKAPLRRRTARTPCDVDSGRVELRKPQDAGCQVVELLPGVVKSRLVEGFQLEDDAPRRSPAVRTRVSRTVVHVVSRARVYRQAS
jgi:hypothetical protein